MTKPLLSVAIPTWKRAPYLALTLEQLRKGVANLPAGVVEVIVSDNHSPDDTAAVVEQVQMAGLPVRYIRNAENIGSDANIAQCFNLASGDYVLILGDDDLFIDGGLEGLIERLAAKVYGVVCLRPYGYDDDYRAEYPGYGGSDVTYTDTGAYLAGIGHFLMLISACIINKSLLPDLDAQIFCGGQLVQVHLVIRAALAAQQNLYIKDYLLAYKRNNTGGYDYAQVFVDNLGAALDQCKLNGLSDEAIQRFEQRLLLTYYPFYLLRQYLSRTGDTLATRRRFEERFAGRWTYRLWVAPMLYLPRPLAIVWGAGVTAAGRIAYGDLKRGWHFARNRLFGRRAG